MDGKQLEALKTLFDRAPSSHKYDFGHVLVIGGAPGMVGAPLLAAQAALRTGAGLVTIASTPGVIDKLEKRVEEVMTLRLPENMAAAMAIVTGFIAKRKVNVLAIGPGLDSAAVPIVKELLRTARLPIILDAGGLAAYSGNLEALRTAGRQNPSIILTPHPGEFARLLDRPLPAGSTATKNLVIKTAQTNGVTIVLKGHHSLVASADGQAYTNPSGNPGLATAGSGDVLTGIIAGLAAQGFTPTQAAVCGVYLHGLAGDAAAAVKTEPGMIASDVIESIPAALMQIRMKNPSDKESN